MSDLRVALIGGGGFMGKAHSVAYEMANVALATERQVLKHTLVDVDINRARAAALELGWANASDDWKAVVADPDVDAIDIVTPPQFHAEIAILAMEHGKHVLSEKPISLDGESAQRMWEVAKSAGVVNQVGFNYRNTPALSYAKELLRKGELGQPLQLRMSYLFEEGFGDIGWRISKAHGAPGIVSDAAAHIIDLAEYLVGEIVRVSGRLVRNTDRLRADDNSGYVAAPSAAQDLGDVDDGGVFLAEFANGAVGTFSTTVHSWGRNNALEFELDASDGAIIFDWTNRDQIQIARRPSASAEGGLRTVNMGPTHPDYLWVQAGMGTGYVESSALQIRNFVNAIASGGQSHPNFGEAAHVQTVLDCIKQSSQTGEWVDVPARDVHASAD